MSEQPDDRDLDDGGLDLTPRDGVDGSASARRSRRRWAPLAVLVALGVVVVLILMQAGSASLYFRNADEAYEQRETLGTDRFRLQGTVVGKPESEDEAVVFKVQYNDVSVTVRHTGSEPALFKAGIPVVAEGHWNEAGTEFESDKLLVKHDSDYQDENPDRLDGDESNDT